MNFTTLQNFLWDSGDTNSLLYYRCRGQSEALDKSRLVIRSNTKMSFDGYFNCFYAMPWMDYTVIRKISACVKLSGSGVVRIIRRNSSGSIAVYLEQSFSCVEETDINLGVDFSPSDRKSRFYLELETDENQHVEVAQGAWIVPNEAINEVTLDLVICTYRKREFAENNVRSLLEYEPLHEQSWRILLVDNGSEIPIDTFDSNRVQVIHQNNVGGSGGFGRGMLESLSDGATHVLLMDDDLLVHAESVFRVIQIYSFVNRRVSFGGAMFDLFKPTEMWESHVSISGDGMTGLNSPTKCLNMTVPRHVDAMAGLEPLGKTAYCGWWFYSCQVDSIRKCGLPLPVFIKRDDEEFCMRLYAHGIPSVSLPGIGTWHEPFYAKASIWTGYFAAYNQLVMASVRGLWKPDAVFAFMKRDVLTALLRFDYGIAEMRILALEDFLLGPYEFMKWNPQERLQRILQCAKKHPLHYLDENDMPKFKYPHRLGISSLLCYLLGGRKRPQLVKQVLRGLGLRKKRVIVPNRRHAWCLGLITDEVVVSQADGGAYRLFRRNAECEYHLRKRMDQVFERYEKSGVAVMSSFHREREHMTSIDFWKKYLAID